MQRYELEVVEHLKEAPMKSMVVSIENSCSHFHFDYEVVFVLKGDLTLKIKADSYPLAPGDVVLVNSSEIHSLNALAPGNLCLILQFSPNLIAEEYGTNRVFRFHLNTTLEAQRSNPRVRDFQRDLATIGLALNDKPDGYQFFMKSSLYHFIGKLFQFTKYDIGEADKAEAEEETLRTFDKVNGYIKANYKEDITIDELCRKIGLSKSSLYRLLKSTSSVTYKDLIDFYRIEHAKDLLKNTNNPISYIAQSSGYDSDGSFYRAFKKTVGIPPHVYRHEGKDSIGSLGIQGYAAFNLNDAKSILKEYC